jgi:DNA recombination protein RmuC
VDFCGGVAMGVAAYGGVTACAVVAAGAAGATGSDCAGGIVSSFEIETGVDRVAEGLGRLDGLVQALSQAPASLQIALLAALTALAVVLLLAALGVGLAIARRREDGFARLAAEALQRNNEGFLTLAAERFRALQETAATELAGRHKAVTDLVEPLHDVLAQYQREARDLERSRADQTGRLSEQLRALASETSKLASALRSPNARGRWGELTLRRTAELAGLSAHCDFDEQATLTGAGGASRPDMLVRLPAGREIAVDAKAPLEAYLDAAEAETEGARSAALERHARHVRRHVDTLASREYHAMLERTPAFVVLFLPDDGFLAGAVRIDRALVEYALGRGVVVATPATLYALLSAVAQGWREEALAENTRHILALAREMDDRLGTFVEHLARLGGSLGRSVEHYNAAVGSLESRVLSQARRMRELGVDGRKNLDTPQAIDPSPRAGTTARPPRPGPGLPPGGGSARPDPPGRWPRAPGEGGPSRPSPPVRA